MPSDVKNRYSPEVSSIPIPKSIFIYQYTSLFTRNTDSIDTTIRHSDKAEQKRFYVIIHFSSCFACRKTLIMIIIIIIKIIIIITSVLYKFGIMPF